MSLDGFITDPDASVGSPLAGNDPGRLHDWRFDAKTETDTAIVDEIYDSTEAVLIGKRMFDFGFEPWGDPPPFGMPVFVATHEEREALPMQGGTTYTFVTDGIEVALELARAVANLASRSTIERLWAPVSLAVAVCCALIASSL
jgi:dihydrofolate reductase